MVVAKPVASSPCCRPILEQLVEDAAHLLVNWVTSENLESRPQNTSSNSTKRKKIYKMLVTRRQAMPNFPSLSSFSDGGSTSLTERKDEDFSSSLAGTPIKTVSY